MSDLAGSFFLGVLLVSTVHSALASGMFSAAGFSGVMHTSGFRIIHYDSKVIYILVQKSIHDQFNAL